MVVKNNIIRFWVPRWHKSLKQYSFPVVVHWNYCIHKSGKIVNLMVLELHFTVHKVKYQDEIHNFFFSTSPLTSSHYYNDGNYWNVKKTVSIRLFYASQNFMAIKFTHHLVIIYEHFLLYAYDCIYSVVAFVLLSTFWMTWRSQFDKVINLHHYLVISQHMEAEIISKW